MLPRPVSCMNTCAGLCGSWRVAARISATSRGGIKGTPPPKSKQGRETQGFPFFSLPGCPPGLTAGAPSLPSPPPGRS